MFNYYARLAKIISSLDESWYIVKINEKTETTKFNGEKNYYDFYYRIYVGEQMIKYTKFQQLDKLSKYLKTTENELQKRIK